MWWVVLVLHLHLPHWDLVRWISFNCLVLPTRQCLDAYLCFVMLILWLVFSLTLHCSHLYWVPWIALNCFALHQVVFQRERSAKTNMLIWAQLQCNFQYSCNCIYEGALQHNFTLTLYIMCKVHVARCTFAVRWKCVKFIESLDNLVLIIITFTFVLFCITKLKSNNGELLNRKLLSCFFGLWYLVEAAVQSRVERRLNAWEAIQVEERLNAANCWWGELLKYLKIDP